MRILHIDRQRHWAGQQVRTYGLCRGLVEAGDHVVFACTPGSGYERRATKDGIPFEALFMRGRKVVSAIVRIARLVRRERIDLIDAHGSLDHHLALAATRVFRSRAVVVRTKHNHTRLRNFAGRFTYGRLTSRIIAISSFVREILLKDGIPPEIIDVVPSSIDTRAFAAALAGADRGAARRRFGIPEGAFVLGTTSRHSPRKGLDVVCEALARLFSARPDAPIVWIAAGRGNEPIARLAAARGLPERALRTPGFLERVTDLFPALDAFLMPSRDEALGVALLEAMAGGVPPIASAVGGIPELVKDGETGLLVPPGDPAALAAAIERLRAAPDLARRFAEAGRALVEKRHDVRRMTEDTRRSYERAMAAPAARGKREKRGSDP